MITRRKLLTGIPAVGSVLLTGCKDSLPPTFGSLFDASNSLTFATHRMLLRNQPLVREFTRDRITKNFPAINETNPKSDRYQHLLAGSFAEWTGVPLGRVLQEAGMLPQARYIVFHTVDGWWDSLDMFDALHPQTLLAYGMNGGALPVAHGAPVRLRVERQLGYKSLKYLSRIDVTDRLADVEDGTGAVGAAYGYSWYAGI